MTAQQQILGTLPVVTDLARVEIKGQEKAIPSDLARVEIKGQEKAK